MYNYDAEGKYSNIIEEQLNKEIDLKEIKQNLREKEMREEKNIQQIKSNVI